MSRPRKKKPPVRQPESRREAPVRPLHIASGYWLAGILAFTAICLWPMLQNGFTNWDDEYYVLKNALLPGPDWKGIWTQPVAANYHPLTMLSLAFNYQVSGVQPSGYLLTNLLLHLLNTTLVFYFVRQLSRKEWWIPVFCALAFGVHPLHVESVAWISERKDLLYAFFFLLSLIAWIRFIDTGKKTQYALALCCGLLSLLSKPAAIVLPLVLLLLDYYRERKPKANLLLEKIPFFLAAAAAVVLTLTFQDKSMAGLEVHTPLQRILFACYGIMTYAWKFFVPIHLSAFYPFPAANAMGAAYMLAPLFVAALTVLIWMYRKNRIVVFGLLFFLVNLVLVLQLVSVGQAVVAERYTYMPYVGLSLAVAAGLLSRIKSVRVLWIVLAVTAAGYGFTTRDRTAVWKNSEALWSDVISQFPKDPLSRTNRASYYLEQAKLTGGTEAQAIYEKAVGDCDIALAVDRKHKAALNQRGRIRIQLGQYVGALEDGTTLVGVDPSSTNGYAIRGKALTGLNRPGEALEDLNRALSLDSMDHNLLYDRGALLFNSFGKYNEALEDFNKAIAGQPQGLYYMTRSFCFYKLGELEKAKDDARMAIQKGTALPGDYIALLRL